MRRTNRSPDAETRRPPRSRTSDRSRSGLEGVPVQSWSACSKKTRVYAAAGGGDMRTEESDLRGEKGRACPRRPLRVGGKAWLCGREIYCFRVFAWTGTSSCFTCERASRGNSTETDFLSIETDTINRSDPRSSTT